MNKQKLFRFLARTGNVVVMAFLIMTLSGLMGWVFFVRGQTLMEEQLKERLVTIASTSSLLFRDMDLPALNSIKDTEKPIYGSAVQMLNMIRATNPGVKFAYILRATQDPKTLQFVADADSLHPLDPYDLNGDGVINEHDTQTPPGTPYDISDVPAASTALQKPSVTQKPYTDQWGTYMSGFAPIRGTDGKLKGIIGIDMDISRYMLMAQSILSPIALLLFTLACTFTGIYVVQFTRNRRLESRAELEADRLSLLQTASHQLGSPVTILRWSLESMRDDMPDAKRPQPLSDHMNDMENSLLWIEGILQSLYRADQVHEKTMNQRQEYVSIRSIAKSAMGEMRSRMEHKKIHLQEDIEGDAIIYTDPALISAVLRELFGNAIDFSEQGSPILLRVSQKNGTVRIDVKDEGCGIPEEEQSELFQKFARASNAKQHKPNGSGLGLYIAKGIIEQSGGEISLQSTLGKGTTVSFFLNAVQDMPSA